jgi:DNA-binding FadR family transcriptional regulator
MRPSPSHNGLVVQILEDLRRLRLQPGDKLPAERTLAEALGVGRSAVR